MKTLATSDSANSIPAKVAITPVTCSFSSQFVLNLGLEAMLLTAGKTSTDKVHTSNLAL